MKIEKLFFISANQMLCKVIDLLGKEKGMDFFTIDNIDEADHFIKDLNPDVILLDRESFEDDSGLIIIENFNTQIPVVSLVEEGASLPNLDSRRVILKPLQPIKILGQLEDLLKNEG